MPVLTSDFSPTLPFKNGHFNTVYRPLFMKDTCSYTRKRVTTWDNDFIDLDFSLVGSKTLVMMIHGLEGSSDSRYIASNSKHLNSKGLDTVCFNLRGCSGDDNLLLGTYHSGKTEDVDFIVKHLIENYEYENLILIGFSLGGNFVIMMIINSDLSKTEQRDLLQPTADSNKLQLIVDSIDDFDPTHDFPEVSVNIHGTDRIGVFSYCMAILNDAGLEVISMHSDLLGKATEGKEEEFLNIINGRATLGMEELNRAAENLRNNKIDITITSVDLENEE